MLGNDIAQRAWWESVRNKSHIASRRCQLCQALTISNSESHWQEHYWILDGLQCAQIHCNLHFTLDLESAQTQIQHVDHNITITETLSLRGSPSEVRAICNYLHIMAKYQNDMSMASSESEPSVVIPTVYTLPRRRRFKLRAEAEPEPVLYLPGGAIG